MICTLTDGFDAATVERIQARLDEVERDHGVRVLWAVESGSRAWGFPSPDSDYDCRFFYVRRHDDYLSPWRPRDVIETPLDGVLDVNGWDLIKAVRLAARSNATVLEWLRSPLSTADSPRSPRSCWTCVALWWTTMPSGVITSTSAALTGTGRAQPRVERYP